MAENILHTMLRGFGPRVEHRGEVVVLGLGRFGSALSLTLVATGHEVLGIDMDGERVQDHTESLTQVAQADTTQERALRQLGVAEAVTAVVCIGSDIEASILTVATLTKLGVPNIWAKAVTSTHGQILELVGAHNVVFPEAEMGQRIARLVTGSLIEYIALDDDFVMIEMVVPPTMAGRRLGDTDIRANYKATVVCIKPEGATFTYAESATLLGARDLIVVAGHRHDLERFAAENA